MSQFSTEALNWLSSIIEERFGHAFKLTQNKDCLRLSLIDYFKGSITFTKLESIFHESHSDSPCCRWDPTTEGWINELRSPLFAPGVKTLPVPLIEQVDDNAVIYYDILGLTYWMLNRIEEIGRTDLDNHQRFQAVNSHAYKHDYLDRPIVDEWLLVLGQVIRKVWPQLTLKQHAFSIKVSHDVDAPSRYGFRTIKRLVKGIAADVIKRGDVKNALRSPYIWLNSQNKLCPSDPYNTFNWIMDQSEKHNLVSAFYFICGRTDQAKDADYELEHPAIRKLLRDIHTRGHEIGLHPSYNSFQSFETIQNEANRLQSVMEEEGIVSSELGGRMHFLRWEHPTTLQSWNDAGMTYDSTLSYADLPGFRCGTCYEYPAFNAVTQERLNLRVRPLIAMECTIIAQRYMGLGYGEDAYNKFQHLKETCRAVNGVFTLLWHNSNFLTENDSNLYLRVLADK